MPRPKMTEDQILRVYPGVREALENGSNREVAIQFGASSEWAAKMRKRLGIAKKAGRSSAPHFATTAALKVIPAGVTLKEAMDLSGLSAETILKWRSDIVKPESAVIGAGGVQRSVMGAFAEPKTVEEFLQGFWQPRGLAQIERLIGEGKLIRDPSGLIRAATA